MFSRAVNDDEIGPSMSLCARYNSTKVVSLKIGWIAVRDSELFDKFNVLTNAKDAIF